MTTKPPQRRRWFQFRLRTLLIAILVLSLPLSWFGARLQKARRQREAVEAIERLGGRVMYDWETSFQRPNGPSWLRPLLGSDFFDKVRLVNLMDARVTDAEVNHIRSFAGLEVLDLSNNDISDTGLENLSRLTILEYLDLGACLMSST